MEKTLTALGATISSILAESTPQNDIIRQIFDDVELAAYNCNRTEITGQLQLAAVDMNRSTNVLNKDISKIQTAIGQIKRQLEIAEKEFWEIRNQLNNVDEELHKAESIIKTETL